MKFSFKLEVFKLLTCITALLSYIMSKSFLDENIFYLTLLMSCLLFRMVDANDYLFTIRKSSIESDDLIESIIYPILILFVILPMLVEQLTTQN